MTSSLVVPLTFVNELYAILQDGTEKSKELAYCQLVIHTFSNNGSISLGVLNDIKHTFNWNWDDRLLCWFFDVLLNYKEEEDNND